MICDGSATVARSRLRPPEPQESDLRNRDPPKRPTEALRYRSSDWGDLQTGDLDLARKLPLSPPMALALNSSETGADGVVIARKYRLESLLGEGGMGAVWRAFNLQLEVPVALKLLRSDLAATDLGERLRVEARAAAKLVHPSIVRIFDIGESESGEPFIVMELLSGESMSEMLLRGSLPAVNAVQLLLPIAEALSLAHSRGVVHRDLKPDNIFIANEGSILQPKLLDFGIAKVTSGAIGGAPTLTQTGTLLGSPDYMSPEQAYAQPDVDERSDIWAFSVVLYEALAGRTPFRGESVASILRSVVQDEPAPLEQVAQVDPALAAIVRRGMTKDREARPASIFELGRELALWLYSQGVLEDVTGASLEAKWLGRSTENVSFASGGLTPRAQHEHATLVSVVHPSPRVTGDPLVLPLKSRRRWLPIAVAAGVTAAAALLLTLAPFKQGAVATAATLPAAAPVVALPAATAEAPVAVAPPQVDVSDIPPLPAPKPTPVTKAAANTKYVAPARSAWAGHAAPAKSLPRALPAEPPAAREKRADLMNPY
ncbi:MAG: serine/threonine protein kinase [Myxococcales bacterium]|nr:MAG: serine/threonine protein kinase [Myxococcales bacterium]